eukprot:5186609-Pyramimonas_sp.AAC.1
MVYRGVLSAAAKPFFDRRGIVVRARAPDQRAWMIERRGAFLRRAMRCTEEQRRRGRRGVSMPDLLSEAVFAGSSLISHG